MSEICLTNFETGYNILVPEKYYGNDVFSCSDTMNMKNVVCHVSCKKNIQTKTIDIETKITDIETKKTVFFVEKNL